MGIEVFRDKLLSQSLFHSEMELAGFKTVIGYEKKFKWVWFASQLNTFIFAVDLGNTPATPELMKKLQDECFQFARRNNKGWPRGIQSAIGSVTILMSENLSSEMIEYCEKIKSGKKWAGFQIPVAQDKKTGQTYFFTKKPTWGRIFFPHLERLIQSLT